MQLVGDDKCVCASRTQKCDALLMIKSYVKCNSNKIVLLIKSNELHVEIVVELNQS